METKETRLNVPGFTADAALIMTKAAYVGVATSLFSTSGGAVVPQQRRSLGCFYTHSQGWVCCYCTPDEGCTCGPWGETMF